MTTIELSTNIPTPTAKPDKEIIFSVMFVKNISTMENSTLSGMLKATTTVGRISCKNRNNTTIANNAPHNKLEITESTIILI